MKLFTMLTVLLLILFSANVDAQFKRFGLKGGFQINGVLPATEFEDDNGMSISSYLVRGYLRYELSDYFNVEAGVGYGNLKGDDYNYTTMARGTGEYSTAIVPLDIRLLITPFDLDYFNPYFYAGFGALYYNVNIMPKTVSAAAVEPSGWTGVLPVGIGTEIKLSDETLLDISAGVNYTFTSNLNYYKVVDIRDAYFNIGLGLTFTNESMNSDKDIDGLTKREEINIGTDPNNPDCDGDGLKDGEEVTTYKTEPMNADTDSDGLNDGEEILKYKTSPLNADTEGDTLKDGDEVMKYKSDPLIADTDGGTVYDGVEVNRGTNPLDSFDDVAIAEMKVQKLKTFDNVLFAINKSELTEESKILLDNIYEICSKMNDAKLQLAGHSSSLATEGNNLELSIRRANAVKDYFVQKGFNADLIYVEAFGETIPVASNETVDGRTQNRRTEIKVAYLENH